MIHHLKYHSHIHYLDASRLFFGPSYDSGLLHACNVISNCVVRIKLHTLAYFCQRRGITTPILVMKDIFQDLNTLRPQLDQHDILLNPFLTNRGGSGMNPLPPR